MSPLAARVAAKKSALPWALPNEKNQGESGMQEQRDALDKMMGGGRC